MAQPKIFVSHSHNDDTFTERLVIDLRQAGADVWMDKRDLGAGNFQQRIDEALANCEWFLLVLTKDALASPWVRQEVYAANRLKNQGQVRDLIFIQAKLMDHRELPATWGVFNIFDATMDYVSARDRALAAVGLSAVTTPAWVPVQATKLPQTVVPNIARSGTNLAGRRSGTRVRLSTAAPTTSKHLPLWLASLGFVEESAVVDGKPIEYILPPLCTVPRGPFLMGSDPKHDSVAAKESWAKAERPQHTVTLPAYEIARFPLTVAEYACFVRAGHSEPPADGGMSWQTQLSRLDHPVVNVTWNDAVAYASWLAEFTGELFRLPTEAEWEKAARGTDGRIYPWGDTFNRELCNTEESGIGTTTPVGSYPTGASYCRAQDLAGDVCEWTSSQFTPYPYLAADGREDANSPGRRVLRGGAWFVDSRAARAACRERGRPANFCYTYVGFRMVRAALNVTHENEVQVEARPN